MLDDTLLADPRALAALDTGGVLRAAATAGAQVRSVAESAAEAGIAELAGMHPRALVLLARPGASVPAAGILTALLGPACPVPVVTAPSGNRKRSSGCGPMSSSVTCVIQVCGFVKLDATRRPSTMPVSTSTQTRSSPHPRTWVVRSMIVAKPRCRQPSPHRASSDRAASHDVPTCSAGH